MSTLSVLAMSFGERVAYSARMFLIGQGTVFLSLAVLWGALVLFQRLVINKPAASPAPPAPVTPPPAPAAPEIGQKEIEQRDDALIAVITAAVAAAMAESNDGEVPNFRVVSFRQV